jgi:hypothetical protein
MLHTLRTRALGVGAVRPLWSQAPRRGGVSSRLASRAVARSVLPDLLASNPVPDVLALIK